jgi:Kelch motif
LIGEYRDGNLTAVRSARATVEATRHGAPCNRAKLTAGLARVFSGPAGGSEEPASRGDNAMRRRDLFRAILVLTVVIVAASCGGHVEERDSLSRTTQALAATSAPVPGALPKPHSQVCPNVGPGHARCHAQVVTSPKGAVVPSFTPIGYGPVDLLGAYNVPSGGGTGQVIGIVDAFDNPNAEDDLAAYRQQYGLPPCTSASGCFTKVNEQGQTAPLPPEDFGWAVEIALDIEMASAICPSCKILLVEANEATFDDLGTSVDTAVSLGATVVSNSYGGSEDSSLLAEEIHYNHPGVLITASTGDFGTGVEYPAASQFTAAVGGTSLFPGNCAGGGGGDGGFGARDSGFGGGGDGGLTGLIDQSGRSWCETAWSGAGSGCSMVFAKPSWQNDPSCTMRSEADLSAVADPSTGVAVFSTVEGGWIEVGGTSVASPVVATILAVTGRSTQNASFVWGNPEDFYDITSGSNGFCSIFYECNAGPGYDGPTGWGTPAGALIGSPIRLDNSAEACAGQGSASATVTVLGGPSGFDGDVTLSLTGVSPTPPAGGEITATFSPNPVPAPPASGSTSTMQILTTPTTPSGTYTLTVQGSSPGVTQSATMTLVVHDHAPGPVALQSPASGADGVALTPTFTWAASTEADSYALAVFSSSDCSGAPLRSYSTASTSLTVPASDALPLFTSLSWQVTASNGCAPPATSACSAFRTLSCAPTQELVTNGGFEQGFSGWSIDATTPPPIVSTSNPHSGANAAALGELTFVFPEPSGDSAVSQVITIPAGTSPTLSFWEWPFFFGSFEDTQYVIVTPISPSGSPVTLMSEENGAETYTQREFPLDQFAGQTVRITFGVHENSQFGGEGVGMNVDDVSASFTRCGPPDFALQVTPVTTGEVCAGNSVSYTVAVSSLNGPNFTSPVTLTASGLPPNTTAAFASNPVAPGQSTTLTLTTTRPIIGQVYPFSVSGTAVNPPPAGARTVAATVIIDANAPQAPQVISPINGAINVPLRPTLSWTAPFVPDVRPAARTVAPSFFGASQYHLQIATDSAFTKLVIDTTLTDTTFTPSADLTIATQYFWRVSATNLCGSSPWSTIASFIVGACSEGWSSVSPVPAPNGGLEVGSAVAVPSVGKIYVIGGVDGFGELNSETWAYDPTSDSWTEKSAVPFPGVGETFGSAVAVGQTIYVFGGFNSFGESQTLWKYDVAGDTWTQGANLPAFDFASAVAAIGGKIYIAYGGGFGNQTWEYDPATDSYTRKADAPALPVEEELHATTIGGAMHVFAGGFQGTSHVVYTPATDTWAAAAAMPFGVTDPAVGTLGGKAIVVGGRPVARTQIYDPSTDSWTQDAPIDGASGGLDSTTGAVLGLKLHVFGGFGGSGVVATQWLFHACSLGNLSSAAYLPFVVDGDGHVSGVTNERTTLLIANAVSGAPLTATCFLYGSNGTVLGHAAFNAAAGEVHTVTDVVRVLRGATTVQNIAGSVAVFGTDLFQVTASVVNNATSDSAFEDGQPVAGKTSGFLPAIEEGSDATQAVFSNLSGNTAILQLLAYPAAGGQTPAAATLALLSANSTLDYADVVQQLKLPRGFVGQLSFSSTQPLATVARAVVPRHGYSGFEPVRGASDAASSVYIPYVEDTTAFSTSLLVSNPTLVPADVTVTYVDAEDTTGGTSGTASSRDVPVAINADLSLPDIVRWVLRETTTTPSGKHGFLVVTTPQGVTAQAKIVDSVTLDPATPPLAASVTSAFSPFLVRVEPVSFVQSAGATGATADLALASAAGGGTTTALSRFALSNPGSTTATVELSAVNASGGSPTQPVVITLPANAQFFTEDLVTAMGLPPLFLGSLIVQSDVPVLVYNQRRSGDTGDAIPVYPQ